MNTSKENYGQDAPGVVRGLALAGVVLLFAARSSGRGGLWLTNLSGPIEALRPTAIATGLGLVLMALWMMISSRWLKQIVLRQLLDSRQWRGDERVLDVGCGRGLVAIGAARRVPNGRVTGIDLWAARDLSGNDAVHARANAEAAGVADRLEIDTGDMRTLPYTDGAFDVVASMTAIHNIEEEAGRVAAVAEIWRVTKPGGQILIYDIRHARAYARQFRTLGATDIRMSWPILLWGVLGWRFSATRPSLG
jgi:SAM-dependent methyltransferase